MAPAVGDTCPFENVDTTGIPKFAWLKNIAVTPATGVYVTVYIADTESWRIRVFWPGKVVAPSGL